MTVRTAETMAATPPQEAVSTAAQIAVLAALASIGTLATNILLPSLPQMALALQVTTPAVTASITIFLVVFALGQLVVGPISDRPRSCGIAPRSRGFRLRWDFQDCD